MIKLYKNVLTFCLLAFMLSSCYTPQAIIIRVQPDENENIFWDQGQAIAEDKKDSIITRAAFSHIDGQFYIFDVEVFNERETPVLVSPETMRIHVSDEYIIPAMDPEKMILSRELRSSRDEVKRKNNAILAGLIIVGATVAIIAASSDNDSDSYYEEDSYDDYYEEEEEPNVVNDIVLPLVGWGINFRTQHILSTQINTIPLPSSIDFWEHAALRKTTLRAGESTRGLIAFPRRSSSKLPLQIIIDNIEFEFIFNQKQHMP